MKKCLPKLRGALQEARSGAALGGSGHKWEAMDAKKDDESATGISASLGLNAK